MEYYKPKTLKLLRMRCVLQVDSQHSHVNLLPFMAVKKRYPHSTYADAGMSQKPASVFVHILNLQEFCCTSNSENSFALTTRNSHELENSLSQTYGVGLHFRIRGRLQKLGKIILAYSTFVYSLSTGGEMW